MQQPDAAVYAAPHLDGGAGKVNRAGLAGAGEDHEINAERAGQFVHGHQARAG